MRTTVEGSVGPSELRVIVRRHEMVRRGSTVRVRQRALQRRRTSALLCMCSVGVEGHQARYGAVYGAFAQRSRSGERGNRVATGFRGEGVAEVGVERAALQPAGLVDGEQPFDRAFAALGTAAE
jgi:hypothetical protein